LAHRKEGRNQYSRKEQLATGGERKMKIHHQGRLGKTSVKNQRSSGAIDPKSGVTGHLRRANG